MRSLVMSAAALAIAAMPAVAQKAGTVEVGVFGRQAWFDTSYELKDKAGAGARLGIFFARNFELEVQGSWVRTESERIDFNHSIDNYAGRAFLEYNINAKPVAFILGVGGHYQQYSGDTESLELGDCINIDACDDNSEYGPSGLIGVRFGVGGVLQVRVDGTVDYSPEPPGLLSRADDGWQYGIQGGLSLVFPKPKPVDTDMDGVPDKLDQCPNTPAGMPVDEKGCPLDDDKDGVINASDLCPNTPAGEAVDASGCSDSQKDDDRDGVMNSLDKCPNTPSGTAVDETGCPKDDDADGVANAADRCPNTPAGEQVDANGCGACQRDSDNDGVADCNDKCPSTNPGSRVDANGCRILGETGSLVLQGVNFATGSAVLTKASKAALDEVAALAIPVMQENASLRLEVGGHTDSTGSAKVNTRLSQRRAEAVEKYLESKGIEASRLTAKGYGPDKPVADNKTKEGRAANRRVELTPLY